MSANRVLATWAAKASAAFGILPPVIKIWRMMAHSLHRASVANVPERQLRQD
jgi:hypothetical protein